MVGIGCMVEKVSFLGILYLCVMIFLMVKGCLKLEGCVMLFRL